MPVSLLGVRPGGKAVKTAIGDKPPAKACLFPFLTVERWGLIWRSTATSRSGNCRTCRTPTTSSHQTLEIKHFEADPWVGCRNTF